MEKVPWDVDQGFGNGVVVGVSLAMLGEGVVFGEARMSAGMLLVVVK